MSEERKSEFKIVNKVMELLNIGDAGKLSSFMRRLIKKLGKEVTQIESNFSMESLKLNNEIDEIQDKIQDAKEDIVNAYHNISVSEISNNQAQDNYGEIYLENIEKEEAKLEELETKLEAIKDKLKTKEEKAKEEIQLRKDRIEMLGAK